MPRHRSLRLRLEHILKGIARIELLTAGKSVEDYLDDEGLREMIERNIARISEAARHVPAGVKAKHTSIPWRQVVGIGNVVRHDYDEIDDLVMWTTATERLLPLKAAVEAMLREIAD
jgi:uncharacterized protein with HEPN domain